MGLLYRAVRLQRVAESIPGLLYCLQIRPLYSFDTLLFFLVSIRMKIKYRKKSFVYIQSAVVPQSFAYSFLKDTFATVKNQVYIHKQHIPRVMKNFIVVYMDTSIIELWIHCLKCHKNPPSSRDGILGHQCNKRLKSFSLCYSQSILLADFKGFKNPSKKSAKQKKTRIYSWIAFFRMEKRC